MAKLFANSGDPDQMPHSAASDLGLHCLPVTLLRVSRLKWVKPYSSYITSTSVKHLYFGTIGYLGKNLQNKTLPIIILNIGTDRPCKQ